MLMHLSEIDGIVLACREEMMKKQAQTALIFKTEVILNVTNYS